MAKNNLILSSAHEDYLKAIYSLQRQRVEVNNSALAKEMGVTPASATNMVKRLADLKLLDYTPYQGVTLTELGRRIALEVLRHHRLLELFLHQALDISWDQVHEEADRMEHVISEALEDAIAVALDHPTVDPHGDPIPSKDGYVAPSRGAPLSSVAAGHSYRLTRVLVQDPERLCYLGDLGLYPNQVVTVSEKAPFDGPLLLEVNDSHHALSFEMAARLLVEPLGGPT